MTMSAWVDMHVVQPPVIKRHGGRSGEGSSSQMDLSRIVDPTQYEQPTQEEGEALPKTQVNTCLVNFGHHQLLVMVVSDTIFSF